MATGKGKKGRTRKDAGGIADAAGSQSEPEEGKPVPEEVASRSAPTVAPTGSNGPMPEVSKPIEATGTLHELTRAVSRDLMGEETAPSPAPVPDAVRTPFTQPTTEIEIDLVLGSLTDIDSEVAVVGRLEGIPMAGPIRDFDMHLDNWLKRAFEQGMISNRVGELTFIPLEQFDPPRIQPKRILVVGMGEAGRLSPDDVRFIYTNIICAVKALNFDGFSTTLYNSQHYGLRLDRAVRAVFDAALDAYDRLRSADLSQGRSRLLSPLKLSIAEPDPEKNKALARRIDMIARETPNLRVKVTQRVVDCIHGGEELQSEKSAVSAFDTNPDVPIVRITVSSNIENVPTALSLGTEAPGVNVVAHSPGERPGGSPRLVFQCSAVTESAVITVRQQELEPYFVSRIADRLMNARTPDELEAYGMFLATYLLPEDFLRLLDTDTPLTLVLDATTAVFPWEMAAVRTNRRAAYFGPHLSLSRQFRTLLSGVPGLAPPLNNKLDVLVIADPAPGSYSLEGARREGLAVVRALMLADDAWQNQLEVNLHIRLGSAEEHDEGWLRDLLRKIGGIPDRVLDDARPCDPLETLALLLRNHYDIVHYAGHGIFDPPSGRRGWVFNRDCVISAKEIFKLHQVPRLVFSNACLSSKVLQSEVALPPLTIQQVSLAEAFFARGIENYIGAGWKVDDEEAESLAMRFYLQALGVSVTSPDTLELIGVAPPATLGEALAAARRDLLNNVPARSRAGRTITTWGAYQHYGQVNSKLLPFTNEVIGATSLAGVDKAR